MSLLQVKNLSIGYNFPLQSDIDFSLDKGEVLLINGSNGTGKSTLIKTIMGELDKINGELEFAPGARVEFLPQSINYDLLISLTLGEVIDAFDVKRQEFNFLKTGFFSQKWSESSGGEKQKTLVMTRVGTSCDILILDEPFNHVDKETTTELIQFLTSLLENETIGALVVISHIKPQFKNEIKVKELQLT